MEKERGAWRLSTGPTFSKSKPDPLFFWNESMSFKNKILFVGNVWKWTLFWNRKILIGSSFAFDYLNWTHFFGSGSSFTLLWLNWIYFFEVGPVLHFYAWTGPTSLTWVQFYASHFVMWVQFYAAMLELAPLFWKWVQFYTTMDELHYPPPKKKVLKI